MDGWVGGWVVGWVGFGWMDGWVGGIINMWPLWRQLSPFRLLPFRRVSDDQRDTLAVTGVLHAF